MKKWIISIVVLAIALAGWRVGSRWYVLHKLYHHPEVRYRAGVVATELDLSPIQAKHGVTCDVGYAEFIIPSTNAVQLKSSGEGCVVLGNTDRLSFFFLIPFNPSAPEWTNNILSQALAKLPASHPYRALAPCPGTTFLDMEIRAEQMLPESLWEACLEDWSVFVVNSILLQEKGFSVGRGMRRVHTYHTSETRGLVRVGETPDDFTKSHVSIQNRAGTQTVGMHIRTRKGCTNDVMDFVSCIVKTFRFKMENLDSKDEIRKIIAGAGIKPKGDQE